MTAPLLTYLEAQLSHQNQLSSLILAHLSPLLQPKAQKALTEAVTSLNEIRSAFQPPVDAGAHWSPERRAKVGAGVAKAHAAKRDQNRLYLYEWQGEEARRLTYDEASEALGLATSTLRTRISQAVGRSLLIYRWGRHVVLARHPEGLEPALRSLALVSGDEAHVVTLPKRAARFSIAK